MFRRRDVRPSNSEASHSLDALEKVRGIRSAGRLIDSPETHQVVSAAQTRHEQDWKWNDDEPEPARVVKIDPLVLNFPDTIDREHLRMFVLSFLDIFTNGAISI